MLIVNPLQIEPESRLEMFLAGVIWNALYFKDKFIKKKIVYVLATVRTETDYCIKMEN